MPLDPLSLRGMKPAHFRTGPRARIRSVTDAQRKTGQIGPIILLIIGTQLALWTGCTFPFDDTGGTSETQGPLGFIGSPCVSAADCQLDGAICLDEDHGYPEGMCTQTCERLCPDRTGHPITFCIDSDWNDEPLCHSRCDFDLFPGTGCRPEYICRLTPRSSQPEVRFGTCVVDDGRPTRFSDCVQELIDLGVSFEMTSYTPSHPEGHPELVCAIDDPVLVHSPVRGMDFCSADGRCQPILMDCTMALALVDLAEMAADYDLVRADHLGTVSCRTISGTDTLSQHALGLAIDLSGLREPGGLEYSVRDHWEAGTDDPVTVQGRLLYDLVHQLHEEHVFNVILTPEYNAAHHDHIHLDLTEGEHFLKSTIDEE